MKIMGNAKQQKGFALPSSFYILPLPGNGNVSPLGYVGDSIRFSFDFDLPLRF
jgi:hypothetical protein